MRCVPPLPYLRASRFSQSVRQFPPRRKICNSPSTAATRPRRIAASIFPTARTSPPSWEGKSFGSPPYYGGRVTWWLENFNKPNWGISLDYTHDKVYADDDTLAKTGWSHFEFTDGLNLITVNGLYRFQDPTRRWTPYLGAGIGVNIPHVEVIRPEGKTWAYEFGGVTLQAQAWRRLQGDRALVDLRRIQGHLFAHRRSDRQRRGPEDQHLHECRQRRRIVPLVNKFRLRCYFVPQLTLPSTA